MKLAKLTLALMLLFLTACVSSLQSVEHFSPSTSHVLIVGKIILDPPLEEVEQTTHWNAIGDGRIVNKIFMATGDDPIHLNVNQLKLSEWQNMLEAELGNTFFLQAQRKRTYLKGAMVMLDAMTQERLWFPGDLYFDVPNGADAIYIGTLKYTRDDFNNVINMQVIDDYSEAAAAVKQNLGSHVQLTPSLLQAVYKKPGQEA